jgi:hypothetical protein
MAAERPKMIVLPVDGSENSLKSLDYINQMFGPKYNLRDLKRFLPKELTDEFPELQEFWQRKAGKVMLPFIQRAKDMLLEAGLREDQITTKLVDGSRSAATDILKEMKTSKAGSLSGFRAFVAKMII